MPRLAPFLFPEWTGEKECRSNLYLQPEVHGEDGMDTERMAWTEVLAEVTGVVA
jgi:hypothetical protein